MTTRLDRERAPKRRIAWDLTRWRLGARGGSVYPKIFLFSPTGVLANSPGTFTPSGSNDPPNLASLQALGALGETTAWTEGQYVILGDDSHAYWDGDSWEEGEAPA